MAAGIKNSAAHAGTQEILRLRKDGKKDGISPGTSFVGTAAIEILPLLRGVSKLAVGGQIRAVRRGISKHPPNFRPNWPVYNRDSHV
jgi:hypothetical protein